MHLISPILLLFLIFLFGIVALRGQVFTLLLMGAVIILVGAMALFSFVLQTLMPDRNLVINPVDVLVTFISLQTSLILGFSALLFGKKNYRWEKIEDVRFGQLIQENVV